MDNSENDTLAPSPEQTTNIPATMAEPETEDEVLEGEEAEGEELEAAAPDDEEVDWDGKKYRVAPELKAALMRTADYTQKTQQVAAQRREVEAMREQATKALQASEEELNMRGELAQKVKTIGEYEKVDWNRLEQDDPLGAQSHWRQYQQLKDAAERQHHEILQRQNQRTVEEQQEIAKRVTATRESAQKEIKGWTPEAEDKAFTFAVNQLGMPGELLMKNMTPAVYKGVYYAWLGYEAANRPAKSAIKPAAQAQSQSQEPVSKLTGKSGASPKLGLRDDISVDEWVKRRNAQVKRQA